MTVIHTDIEYNIHVSSFPEVQEEVSGGAQWDMIYQFVLYEVKMAFVCHVAVINMSIRIQYNTSQ